MQTIDRIIEEGEKKLDIRKQLKGFSKELGKIIAALVFTGILPVLIVTGIIPPAELILVIIGFGLLSFTIILLLIVRLFYRRDKQHKGDIYGLAKNFRNSNDELVNLHMVNEKRWQGRFTGLEERADYGIMEIDINNSKVLTINKVLSKMLGASKKEITGMIKDRGYAGMIASFVHPDYKELFEWTDESVSTLSHSRRIFIKKEDGSYFPAKIKAKTLNINGDKIAQIFINDLSDSDKIKITLESQSVLLAEMTCNLLGMSRDREEAASIIGLMKEEGELYKDA